MPYTQLFDSDIFDIGTPTANLFDVAKHYTVEIEEELTKFDSAVFDPAVFDTTRGGEVIITDLLARVQGIQRDLTESTTVNDSLTRLVAFFRSMADSTSISDSIARVKQTIRG